LHSQLISILLMVSGRCIKPWTLGMRDEDQQR